MYKELNIDKIITTVAKLQTRINERFPESSISRVSDELFDTTNQAKHKIAELTKPNRWIRLGVVATILIFFTTLIYTFSVVEWQYNKPNLAEIIQITEAFINDIILLGAALFFLITFESRIKRQKVLKELHRLRSIAHVIDMHQLTKDPSIIVTELKPTKNSPVRKLTAFELSRYLDYCSEMFSIIGKIAALFSERLPDTTIVSAANDIENLCTGLSKKVWQKMVFLK